MKYTYNWFVIENGDIFEGTREQFEDCFFSNATDTNIREWCKQMNFGLQMFGKEPVYKNK